MIFTGRAKKIEHGDCIRSERVVVVVEEEVNRSGAAALRNVCVPTTFYIQSLPGRAFALFCSWSL